MVSTGRTELLVAFLAQDRRHALAQNVPLAERTEGTALFADVSGFTTLSEVLAEALGPERGAEEVARLLSDVFGSLIDQVDQFRGALIGFSGDAITCWFDQDRAARATTCALAMQQQMARFVALTVAGGRIVSLAMKVAVASGPAHRWLVGDRDISLLDVLAGATIARMATAETLAAPGEVVLDAASVALLGERVRVRAWRADPTTGDRCAVVAGLAGAVAPSPWPGLGGATLDREQLRPFLLGSVLARLEHGQEAFLASLRPTVALFLRFDGIDYDRPPARDQLDAFIRWVEPVVASSGGSLLHLTIGDKGSYLLAGFGVPRAHGDDTLRAVGAALQLRRPPRDLSYVRGIQIGIGEGRAWSGAFGGPTRLTYDVLGDVVNLAARLMQAARPGQILLNAGAAQAVRPRYAVVRLPPISVKGKAEPVEVWALRGARRGARDLLREPRARLRLVGRAAELAELDRRIALALAGQGQVVGVTGEPGIGKSRLVAEAVRRATAAGMLGYGGEAQATGTATAYLAWRPIWRRFFRFDQGAPLPARLSTLERSLAEIDPALMPYLPLLGPALGVMLPDNDVTAVLDARARRPLLERVLTACVQARARTTPMLIVIEDAHWLDSLSRELLDSIGRAAAALPVLLLVTYRPFTDERGEGLAVAGQTNFAELRLGDLQADEAERLIRRKLGQAFGDAQRHVPRAVLDRLTARAHGNPFYIEELLNFLRDRRIDPRDTSSPEQLDLPDSLRSLILSRIDGLTEEQQSVVKVASVIGRLFRSSWLWGAHPDLGQPEHVRADLDALSRLDLTPLDTPEPEPTYLFKHVITQETAYESLAYGSRMALHERLGLFLERQSGGMESPPVDLLAYHFGRSPNREKTLLYAGQAGELAVRNGAYREATQYLGRALELVQALPDSPARARQELGALLNLGGVLLATRGQGSPEAKAVYDRALALCQTLEASPQQARALFGLWTFYLFRGEIGTANGLVRQILDLARRTDDREALLQAHFAASATIYWLGELQETVAHAEEVIALYDPSQHHTYLTRYAQNPRVTAMACATCAVWMLGHPERAIAMAEETEHLAGELGHELVTVIALQIAPMLYQHMRDTRRLAATVGPYLERAGAMGNPVYVAIGQGLAGWLQVAQGQPEQGMAEICQARAGLLDLGVALLDPMLGTILADACLLAGAFDEGLATLAPMLAAGDRGPLLYLAEQCRLEGELLLGSGRGDDDAVEGWFQRALSVARGQQARSFELRAAMSLARLWRRQGKRAQARALLAPIYGWFTEGLETPDLQAAAALLER